MKLIKCEREHYFDSDKFDSCPHCANIAAEVKVANLLGKNQKQVDTLMLEKPLLENQPKKMERHVTGWLVCTEGEMQGESFTLYEGENHIGRAPHMDVVLLLESTVSRENHAVITYDDRTHSFTLTTDPDLVAPVLYNNRLVKKKHSQTLSAHDILTLGDCQLHFIPFCGKHFHWESSCKK